MRVALVNPPWSFDGSIYFGCREPHLPIELGYAAALLARSGHEAALFDAQLGGDSLAALRAKVAAFAPDMTVITTAPSYLFWRCAQPELRVPMEAARALEGVRGHLVIVGPHGSTSPTAALQKLGADAVVIGECEEVVVALCDAGPARWSEISSIARWASEEAVVQGTAHASDVAALPVLRWEPSIVARHAHHHHRFDVRPEGPGGELEASRGCPFRCTFCAKESFRDTYRKRPLATVLGELDGLVAAGARYVYFVDEIFLPDVALLEALVPRRVPFGVQLRIDQWSLPMLTLLGQAGCVSIEAGVESVTAEGRARLAKRCRLSTDELATRLVFAKQRVPFVQANLLASPSDDSLEIRVFRDHLRRHGVWSNDPVPLFPYPGSPEYTRRWGLPDEVAWERAHADYLTRFAGMSDLQDQRPRSLAELEIGALDA